MDLRLSEEQEHLVSSFADLLAKESSTEVVRAAEPLGFDAGLWRTLAGVGAVTMAVAEDGGGWGASTVDLTLVAEQFGRAIAPAPVIEAQVAARLLASIGGSAARVLLDQSLGGEAIVTLGLHPVRNGVAPLVPAGAVADQAIVLAGDRLLVVRLGRGDRRRVDNLGGLPLADVPVSEDALELAHADRARDLFERAIDEWLMLTAAALVGIGAKAHELTCAYVTERQAWGVPIGTFQAVAHPLADSATALDGARLLSRKAGWSSDQGAHRTRELAAMAFAFASETARDATYRAIHFHGGYGFMLEYPVQLYYRRARAWARLWGEPESAYSRVAQARYSMVGGS